MTDLNTVVGCWQSQIELVAQLFDALKATDPEHPLFPYRSFEYDRAATDLRTIHLALAEGWDIDRYRLVSIAASLDQQVTRESDPRWARL